MKNFKDYLVESEKTFAYRIKIVGDVPSGFIKDFREKLKKFDPVSVGEVKTTPILSQPQDFPAFSNESVNIMDATFRYPATGPQIQQIAELCGLDADRIVISQLNYAEGMDKELAARLASGNIHTRDDLGELAVDELVELTGIDEERAKTVIMGARAHWFA